MENQAATETRCYEDVRKSGYLRKPKSAHRRFFVLRAPFEHGPARLEYYESEKKFRSKSPVPKKVVDLDSCFNINKRADSKNKHMIVLHTRGESFAVAADTEELQNEWFQAMSDLQCRSKTPDDYGIGGECGLLSPGSAFKEVWQVKLWPKGLGQARNLIGIYRLCLTDNTVNFVKINSDAPAVVLQLMNVRRCGHSENFFFIEVGRSAVTGPGEFWMQVEDSVVAQNMHETLLEAMKALSEEFRQRSKTQPVGTSCGGGTSSNPISVPSRRHHPNLPPSQVGFSRRARTETPGVPHSNNTSPTFRQGFSRSRTASIGARTDDSSGRMTALSTSPSLNGSSCSTTPTLRPKPTRAPTPAKITLSLAPYAPKNPAPSPAPSLSSSSGHGSECGLSGAPLGTVPIYTYSRIPQRVSMSGSPSDYGSSDEYGSSPAEHSLLAGGLSTALVDGSMSCILVRHRDSSHKRVNGRRIFRHSCSSMKYEAERRLLSKRTSLPPSSALDHTVPHCREAEDEEDENYTVMSRSTSRESFTSLRGSGSSLTPSGKVETSANKGVNTKEGLENTSTDSGYMSMLPGVTATTGLSLSVSETEPKGGEEYMTMTTNSIVSPPQNIRLPVSEGYMMMSPHSSCSPDLHGMSGCLWGSRSSMESRAGSDYINMSPICARSACSTPPSHTEQHQLQPKTVYSYFSLPRSYKHTTLSTRFEDNLGDGRRVEAIFKGEYVSGRKSGCDGYINRVDSSSAPNEGGNLSLSSSSFSSSSAESLEDKPLSLPLGGIGKTNTSSTGHRGSVNPKDSAHHFHQQRRGAGVQKQSHPQQRKARPFSLFVDMSKANTLPRVKETIQPLVSQSSGEYVSIVYQGDQGMCNRRVTGGDQGSTVVQEHSTALYQPTLCQIGGTNLPRSFSAPLSNSISLSSEYVNMDLGHSSSPLSCTSLSTFNYTPATSPKAREDPTRASQVEQESKNEHRKNGVSTLFAEDMTSASLTDYTEMVFGLPVVQNPLHGSKPGQTAEPSSVEEEKSMNLHSPNAFPKLDHSARLVRAESSVRQRHHSDTFNAPRELRLSPFSSSIFAEAPQVTTPRCHGLESTLWATGQPSSPGLAALAIDQASSLSLEQGLNYIDLDLAGQDNAQMSLDGSSGLYFTVLGDGLNMGLSGTAAGGSSNSRINTYASIDFFKSEELRAHQNTRKDSKVKCSEFVPEKVKKPCEEFINGLRKIRKSIKITTEKPCKVVIYYVPIVSRAGIDIEAALQQLDRYGDKYFVLVVLRHTFDRESIVPDSSTTVKRDKTKTVDCLFSEDEGLLQCHHNQKAIKSVASWLHDVKHNKVQPQKSK